MKNFTLFLLAALLAGCASITGSSTERLRVVASPPGASVQVDGELRGTSPMSVELSKQERSNVRVSAPGYHAASCDTRMSASGGYIAADVALCVFFFPIGCLSFIDAAGAWNKLEQPHCHLSLLPDESQRTKPEPTPAKASASPLGS